MTQLTLTQPDDWHLHLRDGAALRDVVNDSARQFGRALIMPNLTPPLTTVADALAYRRRIVAALPEGNAFDPLMTLYLTDHTPREEVIRAAETPETLAFKLYPAGATTHSDAGVTELRAIYPILETMQLHDLPLLIHGEITDRESDIFDREKLFIERHLIPLTAHFPELRIVLEHVTTREGIDFVRDSGPRLAATLTAHHLIFNRNALLAGGVRPHYYCLPILKREPHRRALLKAATSGDPSFFLGTDSAPHPRDRKESACGCAGCYTAHAALELYATAFESVGALNRLEGFASHHGPDFYRLPRNTRSVTLEKMEWSLPESLRFGDTELTPLMAGESLPWRLRQEPEAANLASNAAHPTPEREL